MQVHQNHAIVCNCSSACMEVPQRRTWNTLCLKRQTLWGKNKLQNVTTPLPSLTSFTATGHRTRLPVNGWARICDDANHSSPTPLTYSSDIYQAFSKTPPLRRALSENWWFSSLLICPVFTGSCRPAGLNLSSVQKWWLTGHTTIDYKRFRVITDVASAVQVDCACEHLVAL